MTIGERKKMRWRRKKKEIRKFGEKEKTKKKRKKNVGEEDDSHRMI